MDEVREGLLYTESHEWIEDLGDGRVRMGISDHAQHELGDIVYVELPDVGRTLSKGDEIGALESVKTVEPVITPVSGKVIKVNDSLEDGSELMNRSPYDEGWLVEVELSDPAELQGLMDSSVYAEVLKSQ